MSLRVAIENIPLCLQSGERFNLYQWWGPATNDLVPFDYRETLLMTSKMCIFFCTCFVLPCPILRQQSSHNCCIFPVARNYCSPFWRPLLWRSGVHVFPAQYPQLLKGRHRPSTGSKLYCLVTDAHMCKQLAIGSFAALFPWELKSRHIDHKSNALTPRQCAISEIFTHINV